MSYYINTLPGKKCCAPDTATRKELDGLIIEYKRLIKETQEAREALILKTLALDDIAHEANATANKNAILDVVAKEVTSELLISAMHHPDVIKFGTTHYIDFWGYEKINGTWYIKWKSRETGYISDYYYTYVNLKKHESGTPTDAEKIYTYNNGRWAAIAALIGEIYYYSNTDIMAKGDAILAALPQECSEQDIYDMFEDESE